MNTPAGPDTIHPLAIQDKQRIDILYGGTESEVLMESTTLSQDILAEGLQDGEKLLYINTLVSTKVFAAQARRACRNINDQRFNHITLLDDKVAGKLEFLTKLVVERKIRYVILNGFEFATFTSRHRIQIFCWLKSLRDHLGVSVIVFTQSGPRRYGTLGQMRFISETCEEVGAYKREKEDALEAEKRAAARAAKAAKAAEAARPKSELEIFEAKIKKHPDGTPIYYADRTKLQWLRDQEAARLEKEAAMREAEAASLKAEAVTIEAETATIEAESTENETLKIKDLDHANVASA